MREVDWGRSPARLPFGAVPNWRCSRTVPLRFAAYKLEKGTLLDDKNALNAFFLNVTTNSGKFTWNRAEHVCTWEGIGCDPTKELFVKLLHLPGKSIIGRIPPNTIGKLKSLQFLSLHDNNFTGPIPADFSDLQNLRQFVLSNNSFSGSLPNLNGKRIHVLNFNVSRNKLSGCIPESLSKFSISPFSRNNHLCGHPDPLSNHCPNVCTTATPISSPPDKKPKNKFPTGAIVGIAVGSPILLLVLLACLRKDRNL